MPLTDLERGVCDAIAAESDRLVEITSRLIGFDTTAREIGDPARDETALQEYLAGRLLAIGASPVRREVEARIAEGARGDECLAENAPVIEWADSLRGAGGARDEDSRSWAGPRASPGPTSLDRVRLACRAGLSKLPGRDERDETRRQG